MDYHTTPYSEGSPSSSILFVAEAPGVEEMRKRRPLVGPTGKIFNESLHKAGILRSEIQIANVCRERIPSIAAYFNQKSGHLTERGLLAQRALLSHIEDSKANVISPMGALALACLIHETKGRILKYRGSILESTVLPGRKVIPTVHPAFILPGRGPYVYQYVIVKDYERIKAQAEFPEVRRPPRELLIEPTFNQVVEFLQMCKSAEKVGADIETYNYQVSCFSFAPSPSLSMSIPFVSRFAGEHYWMLDEEVVIWKLIQETLNATTTVWQSGVSFDIPLLFYQNKLRVRKFEDTMVRHRIAFPDFPAKLEFICSNFTEEPYYKDDRKLWMTPAKDPDKFWRYNARDSAVTREAEDPLCAIIEGDADYKWTYDNTMASAEPCLYAGCRGMLVDKERLESLRVETVNTIEAKQKELNSICGAELNVNSFPQCTQYFYGTKGFYPYRSRKTGNPTRDDKALARIVRKYNAPEARLVQELRNLKKLLSTYIEVEFDTDGRLRCTYDVRGTTSGRFSSRSTPWGTGMNSQNMDPRFKEFLVPDPEEGTDEGDARGE